MRPAIILVVAVILLAIGAWILTNVLASDETQIRWRLTGMVDRFNGAHRRGFMEGVADDYRDETMRFDHAQLRDLLAFLFLRERDQASGAFLHRVVLPEEIRIDIDDSGVATAEFPAHFYRLENQGESPDWEIDVRVKLVENDAGWQVTSSRFTPTAGRRPF